MSIKSGEDLLQVFLIIMLVIVAVILLAVVINIFRLVNKVQAKLDNRPEVETMSFWDSLTNATPISKEESIVLDHNYDGIRELDNHLPPWWVGLLYGSIAFAVIYMLNYHIWKWTPLQGEEYEIAMQEGKKEVDAYLAKAGDSIDENSVKYLTDEKTIASGSAIYAEKCVACHGAALEGGVGPNLTDEFWIHGGTVNEVFSVIKNGVPEKGMIAWKATLKPKEIQEVSSYILSMVGSNPANPKAPQGEKASGGNKVDTAEL